MLDLRANTFNYLQNGSNLRYENVVRYSLVRFLKPIF